MTARTAILMSIAVIALVVMFMTPFPAGGVP